MGDISTNLIDAVRTARAEGRALSIIGGNTKSAIIGRTPIGAPLDVSGHTGIVDYQPSELVLTARAGTRLSEIEAALDENGQMLSFEPPYFGDRATLGGTLACNLSGPARPWGGSVRDAVLGVRLIDGKGEHMRFGGQVMKNVAGYDVSRFQAGALGILGVMTEISLKVLPKAETTVTLVRDMDGASAIELMNARAGQPKPLNACAWVAGRLYTRLSGAQRAVEHTAQLWDGDRLDNAATFWSDLREHKHAFFDSSDPLWRFSIKSSTPPLGIGQHTVIDWGGAQRWVRGEHDKVQMETMAALAKGHVSLFRGGDRASDVRQDLSTIERRLHQRLKTTFDPYGILNPGRLYSWM